MFQIVIPITKAERNEKGKLIVRGIATDPTIDLENERFDEGVMEKMKTAVNKGVIPIRVEHENKFYTEVGTWKFADVDKDLKLHVEGEIDTDMSLGKDIEVLLNKRKPVSLSVGGRVHSAGFEYNKDLGKSIKVYKDITLDEISVVKNPANLNTSLSLAKSVDWQNLDKADFEKGIETPEARKMEMLYRGAFAVDPSFIAITKEENPERIVNGLPSNYTNYVEMFDSGIKPLLNKLGVNKSIYDDDIDVEPLQSNNMTSSDFMAMLCIMKFMARVKVDTEMECPQALKDYEYVDKLPEECFIVFGPSQKSLPHHNLDYTVNKEQVMYAVKQIVNGDIWMTPKNYTVAINHLYHHLRELSLLKEDDMEKACKDDKKKKSIDIPEEGLMIGDTFLDKDQLETIKSVYEYTEGISKDMPEGFTEGELSVYKGKIGNIWQWIKDRFVIDQTKREEYETAGGILHNPGSNTHGQAPYSGPHPKKDPITGHLKAGWQKNDEGVEKKVLTAKERNELPDSAFAYVNKETGVRKLPIFDEAHVKNALSRFNQTSGIPAEKKKAVLDKILSAAKKFEIEVKEKSKLEDDTINRIMKHHNEDGSLNINQVLAGLLQALSGAVSKSQTEVDDIYDHLFYHFTEHAMKKSVSSESISKEVDSKELAKSEKIKEPTPEEEVVSIDQTPTATPEEVKTVSEVEPVKPEETPKEVEKEEVDKSQSVDLTTRFEKVEKTLTQVAKFLESKEEDVQKTTALEQRLSVLEESLTKTAQVLETLAKNYNPGRRSVATYTAIEKSFSGGVVEKTDADKIVDIQKSYREQTGRDMPFNEAYAVLLKERQSQA